LVSDGDWIESKDQDPAGELRLIQLMDIGDGHFLDRSRRFVNEATAQRLRCTELAIGDVLVARMPDPLGRACLFPGVGQRAITAVDVFIWRGDGALCDPRWLAHTINSPQVRVGIESQAGGTTRQRIAGGKLKTIELPLPPLAEQRRIVAKLDQVMARMARARAELARIPALIAHHKRAILAAAFSDWIVDAVPTAFTALVSAAQNGLSKRRSDGGRDIKVLRLADLSDGVFSGDSPRSIALTDDEASKYLLRENDLVCIRVNGSENLVGRMLVWGHEEEWAFCDHFIRFQLNTDAARPSFVSWFFASDSVRAQIETSFVSSAGQKTVSQGTLGRILVPVPSIDKQDEVVARIEAAFAWLDKVAHEHAQATRLLDHLDQALLAKAFRGELVSQDPADEPAAKLLARIRAERETAAPATRKRKARA